jgi:AhpD family alkylhydroperoxidase
MARNWQRADPVPDQYEAEQRRLHRLGLGEGVADREVPQREELQQQQGPRDLPEASRHRPEHEGPRRPGQRRPPRPGHQPHRQQRPGRGEGEAGVTRPQHACPQGQRLLQRAAKVLQEGRCGRQDDPEFHDPGLPRIDSRGTCRQAGLYHSQTRGVMSKSYPEITSRIAANMRVLRQDIPETMQGFQALAHAATRPGVLDTKTKELIALAIGVATRCDGCIGFHMDALVKLGVTREEVLETLGMAVYMGGGPSVMYAADAVMAFEQYREKRGVTD